MISNAGSLRRRRAELNSRVAITATQNIGSARSLAIAPEVPSTSEAPSVTKLPVSCAVNNPCSARKPAVSTNPALKLSSNGRAGRSSVGAIPEVSQRILQLDPEIVAVVPARLPQCVANLVVNGLERAGQMGIEPIIQAKLPIRARPGATLSGRAGDGNVGLDVD